MSELVLHLANEELALDLDPGVVGGCRLTDRKTGEVYEAPDLGVVRIWDRTEDRMWIEILTPDPEKNKTIGFETRSPEKALIRCSLGGEGNRSAMGAVMQGIRFDIEIELKGAAVEIAIPEESLAEQMLDRFALFSIELLPNLGATPKGSPGFLIVPAKSGGVYYFDRRHPKAYNTPARRASMSSATDAGLAMRWGAREDDPAEYASLVYGAQCQWEDLIEVPVYATIRDVAGLGGFLMGGAFDTQLIARRDQGAAHLASIHPRFNYRYLWNSKRDTETRRMRLVLLRGQDASYSGLANVYRDYLVKEKGVKTLQERARDNESLRYFKDSFYCRFMGGMTFADGPRAYQNFAKIASYVPWFKEAGLDKMNLILVGANLGGHDWAHPTIFPFEPTFGGEEEMKILLQAVKDHDYHIGLHTNYKDVYRHAPDWDPETIQVNEWGELRYHGAWMGGYSYQGLPHRMKRFPERDFPKLKAMGFRGFWYFDAVGGVMEETFPPGEPITRREYCEGMNDYFEVANRIFGCCGNEVPVAASLGVIVNSNVFYGGMGPIDPDNNGFARHGLMDHFVPLENMVFHGLCFYGGGAEVAGRSGYEIWKDVTKDEVKQIVQERYHSQQEWRGDLDWAFFTGHEEIEDGVTRSEFSDGTVIYASKRDQEWSNGKVTLEPKGYKVIKP